MPKITTWICDICKEEFDGVSKFYISTGTEKTVEHTITIDLNVKRRGSVNSVSESMQMPDDRICFGCYFDIILNHVKDGHLI